MASNTWYKDGTYYASRREKLLAAAKEKYRENREQIAAARRLKKILHSGVTPPELCTICERKRPLVWDHCHRTGKFRGWICYPCNMALGMVRDDVAVLGRMIDYLDLKSRKSPQ